MNNQTELLILCENIKILRKQFGLAKNSIIPKRLSCDIIFIIYPKYGITPKDIFSKIIELS